MFIQNIITLWHIHKIIHRDTWLTMNFPEALIFFAKFYHFQPAGFMPRNFTKQILNEVMSDIDMTYIEYEIFCKTIDPSHPCYLDKANWNIFTVKIYVHICHTHRIISQSNGWNSHGHDELQQFLIKIVQINFTLSILSNGTTSLRQISLQFSINIFCTTSSALINFANHQVSIDQSNWTNKKT